MTELYTPTKIAIFRLLRSRRDHDRVSSLRQSHLPYEDRIEYRLLSLSRRKGNPARRLDENQFLRSDRAVEDCCVAHSLYRITGQESSSDNFIYSSRIPRRTVRRTSLRNAPQGASSEPLVETSDVGLESPSNTARTRPCPRRWWKPGSRGPEVLCRSGGNSVIMGSGSKGFPILRGTAQDACESNPNNPAGRHFCRTDPGTHATTACQ
jgi:hypothetical protein